MVLEGDLGDEGHEEGSEVIPDPLIFHEGETEGLKCPGLVKGLKV